MTKEIIVKATSEERPTIWKNFESETEANKLIRNLKLTGWKNIRKTKRAKKKKVSASAIRKKTYKPAKRRRFFC